MPLRPVTTDGNPSLRYLTLSSASIVPKAMMGVHGGCCQHFFSQKEISCEKSHNACGTWPISARINTGRLAHIARHQEQPGRHATSFKNKGQGE